MSETIINNKINFDKKLDEILLDIKNKRINPTLLLHSCCGPCSTYCIDHLKDYFKITVLFFNPNIYPQEEYYLRLYNQKKVIETFNETISENKISIMEIPYNHEEYLSFVKGFENEPEGGLRCEKCFNLRIKKTAMIATNEGYDYFATTLTVSPHKNAILINHIGKEQQNNLACGELKPLWLVSDFKKNDGYKKSIILSKEMNLYRQNYCGCEFSIY